MDELRQGRAQEPEFLTDPSLRELTLQEIDETGVVDGFPQRRQKRIASLM